jgi:signal transduction histidine kinase
VGQDILSKANKRNYFRSSSFMMAMLFTVLLGSAASILGYTGYYLNRNYFILTIEKIIDTEFSYLRAADKNNHLSQFLSEHLSKEDRIYFVTDNNHKFLMGNIKTVPIKLSRLNEEVFYFIPEGRKEKFATKSYQLSPQKNILIGADMSYLIYTEVVILWMGAATILLMMLVVIASYLISNFVVRRTNIIAETARDIMDTGDLSRRITIDSRWDDLGNMAYILNLFLGRIEELMEGIKRVSDNIAHDLRTPLTRLRNHLEILKGNPDEVRGHTDSLIKEADHILDTFQALLRISKIENLTSREFFISCDLSQILRDVIEFYEPLAAEKNILITSYLPHHSAFVGDINLLFQMFANIIDNSIKFTPAHGEIILNLTEETRNYTISIEDSGGGIPLNEQKFVFDRFYRGEKSRTTDGNGLGLSLVNAVLKLHKGKIFLQNTSKGLQTLIKL